MTRLPVKKLDEARDLVANWAREGYLTRKEFSDRLKRHFKARKRGMTALWYGLYQARRT